MNREQFITLVESNQKALRRFLIALCCGDSQLADDIAQETYIKAYLSCNKLNNVEKFKAWIFQIGHNTLINHKRVQHAYSDEEDAINVADETATDSAFNYQELYVALNKLPDKERTSVLLFYMEGYSIKEIAQIVEASQDAVKQHLSRGRNHLRGLLSSK
jgi:RNA polymerase sigma-70 factor (ECF subfamily)